MLSSVFGKKKKKCKEPCCEERRLRDRLENLALARTLSHEQHQHELRICDCGGIRNQTKFFSLCGRKKKRNDPELNRRRSESESDGNGGTAPPRPQYLPQMPVSKNSPVYNMTHPHRGKAVIFNFVDFHNTSSVHSLDLKPRMGSTKDMNDFKHCLEKLDFDVHTYDSSRDNLGNLEFWRIVHSLRDEDHRQRDCLLVAIMTHGEKNHIFLSDGTLTPVNLIWEAFHADKCPTLAGKPKIFIIQACRGKTYDHGTRLEGSQQLALPAQLNDVTDFASFSYVIPNASDIFVAFSCPLGHYSWRNPTLGSWFIQAICKVFSKDGYKLDLHGLFTAVSREVALNCESSTDDPTTNKKRQVPSVSHTLIRTVMFTPKQKSMPSFLEVAEVHQQGGTLPLEATEEMNNAEFTVPAADGDGVITGTLTCSTGEIESSTL